MYVYYVIFLLILSVVVLMEIKNLHYYRNVYCYIR